MRLAAPCRRGRLNADGVTFNMHARRVFLDTEWTGVPWSESADLLWIGLADEAGESWCGLCSDASVDPANREYVSDLMRLVNNDVPPMTRRELCASVRAFCGDVTEFWAWVPTLASFAAWSRLGSSAAAVYERCRDIDFRMLQSLVVPWPSDWPAGVSDLNQAAVSAGVTPPPRAPNHLHPRVHASWNQEHFRLIRQARAIGDA
jgi:hypothetical protein